MYFAASFVLIYSAILTLGPAVRLHSWTVDYRWMHWIGAVVWLVSLAVLYRQWNKRLPDVDPYILPCAALLTGFGLLTIWRLDADLGMRQTIWLAGISAAVAFALHIHDLLPIMRRYKYVWLTAGILLTAVTFIFGTYPGGVGPRLWLGCCGLYLQPSEILKILLIIFLAAYMADRLPLSFSLLHLLAPTLLVFAVALALLVAQRDLGTASIFIALYTIIIYLASGKRRVLLTGALVLTISSVAGYFLFDVIRLRVDTWLNPWADTSGRSYQIIQSILAVASGSLFGSGPGLGSPGLVPVAQSDFVFAAIGEETGLIGGVGVILIMALLVSRGFIIAMKASQPFHRYLAAGLSASLAIQSLLIMGGNLGLVPLTGVTLPFVSYGGSSLLVSLITLLLLGIISSHPEEEPASLPTPRPYRVVVSLLLAGFLLVSLINGWWSIAQQNSLITLPTNARPAITDRYVKRGSILDNANTPIAVTVGEAGNYTRSVSYPQLAATIGYTNSIYGLSGLEAGLDEYLRGTKGNPSSLIWSTQLLYAQTPPGLDVRLTINLDLQKQVDSLLDGHTGAAVVLNAESGEILAISSQPTFDPNTLEENWSTWATDEDAYFLNRATQGTYPPGTALGPFWLAQANSLPELPAALDSDFAGHTWRCANILTEMSWNQAIQNGCPGAVSTLAATPSEAKFALLYHQLGLDNPIDIPIQLSAPFSLDQLQDLDAAALGQDKVTLSPLEMAVASAGLSTGTLPAPRLASSVYIPSAGWLVLSNAASPVELDLPGRATALELLADPDLPIWYTTAQAWTDDQQITWFIGGTISSWQGTQLSIAIVLEEDHPELARMIGLKVLQSAIQP